MQLTIKSNAPVVNGESIPTAIRRRIATLRYRSTHREQIAARDARCYLAHRDRILESRRAHYADHREELKAKRRERFQAHQQRELKRRRRETYLFRHPEAVVWYDKTMARRERFQRNRPGTPEWCKAEKRRKKRYL